MKFEMTYENFYKYFAKFSLGLMILGGIYILVKPSSKNVKSYQVDDNLTYTGKLVHGKFEGKGALSSRDGLYKGDFASGRFTKDGIFIGKDYYYIKENGQVKIKFNNGRVFIKNKDQWEEVASDEN